MIHTLKYIGPKNSFTKYVATLHRWCTNKYEYDDYEQIVTIQDGNKVTINIEENELTQYMIDTFAMIKFIPVK